MRQHIGKQQHQDLSAPGVLRLVGTTREILAKPYVQDRTHKAKEVRATYQASISFSHPLKLPDIFINMLLNL
jgi:hypothetical protein